MRLRRSALALALLLLSPLVRAGALEDELGRSEVRVLSAPFSIASGRTLTGMDLPDRLKRLGYRRVHARPERPGEWFWGNEVAWIWRRAHRLDGELHGDALFGLRLRRADGLVLGAHDAEGVELPLPKGGGGAWLEPEILAESFDGDRAPRLPMSLDELPEQAWQALLAAEDARFFEHSGLDAKGIARALLANVEAGGIAQGGSTITQQLVKMRDLSPKRTVGRKLSEAARALALEAEHDKREILEAYLDRVYYGHVGGLAVHGIGAAAQAWLGQDARELGLAESALLAAMVQGPNRLAPDRHPERARERRDWVLRRMGELGWAEPRELAVALAEPLRVELHPPPAPLAPELLAWIDARAAELAPKRHDKGRGALVETGVDATLQRVAEDVVRRRLGLLRVRNERLRSEPLQAALVALDARDGSVVALVGGDPTGPRGGLDRARFARRQPGSTIKPLLLFEAFEDCGSRGALSPSSRVADEPYRLELDSGAWEPANADGRFRGVVSIREALKDSLNVPFARLAQWCGPRPTAARLRRLGLDLPEEPPPSFALGSIELSPLELAEAYTALSDGRLARAEPFRRWERPGGRRLSSPRGESRRVASAATAWLVRDLLRTAVREGTASVASPAGPEVAAKTGTSSGRRDAWMAGEAAGLAIVVWVGLDDGGTLGLGGATAAGPIWTAFARSAVAARPRLEPELPEGLVRVHVDPKSGLRVSSGRRGAEADWARRGALPPKKRWWRADEAVPVVR